MRTITVVRDDTKETREIRIRALKRKEIRALKDAGYTYVRVDFEKASKDEAIDKVMGMILPADDIAFLDECDNNASAQLLLEVFKATYGDKDEEKNLSATTGGTPTEPESTTAGPAKDSTSSPPPA